MIMSLLVVQHLYQSLPSEDFHTTHGHLSYMLYIKLRPIFKKKTIIKAGLHSQCFSDHSIRYHIYTTVPQINLWVKLEDCTEFWYKNWIYKICFCVLYRNIFLQACRAKFK